MNFILQRYSANNDSTLGLLFEKPSTGPLKFFSYVLEDEHRDVKVAKETRIQEGFYELVIRHDLTPKTKEYQKRYDWFEKHIEIKNVPNFTGVYIHIGNTDDDTDGCLLLGDKADNNQVNNGMIEVSTVAFKRFYLKVYGHLNSGGKAFLEIRNESKLI